MRQIDPKQYIVKIVIIRKNTKLEKGKRAMQKELVTWILLEGDAILKRVEARAK